jgi:hypothetical protein
MGKEETFSNKKFDIDWYKNTIRENLNKFHDVPYFDIDDLLNRYEEEIKALFDGGIAASTIIYWFYLDWRCNKNSISDSKDRS